MLMTWKLWLLYLVPLVLALLLGLFTAWLSEDNDDIRDGNKNS